MNRELIIRLRTNKGMNQYEFSKHVGISRGLLAQIEAGYITPSQSVVAKIHSKFDGEYIEKVRALI